MKNDKILTSLIFSMLPFLLMAQMETSNKPTKTFSNGLGAVDYRFQVGTQAGFSSSNTSFLNTYFSPSAQFNVTKNFSIVAGVGTSFTQLNNYSIVNNDGKFFKTDAKLTSIYSYASGIYKVSPKVNINAGVFVEKVFTTIPGAGPTMDRQYKDISLGINYNVSKHISFNAQIQFSDHPYQYYNPYQRSSGFQGFSGSVPYY